MEPRPTIKISRAQGSFRNPNRRPSKPGLGSVDGAIQSHRLKETYDWVRVFILLRVFAAMMTRQQKEVPAGPVGSVRERTSVTCLPAGRRRR